MERYGSLWQIFERNKEFFKNGYFCIDALVHHPFHKEHNEAWKTVCEDMKQMLIAFGEEV